jgi:lactam utilization protein B
MIMQRMTEQEWQELREKADHEVALEREQHREFTRAKAARRAQQADQQPTLVAMEKAAWQQAVEDEHYERSAEVLAQRIVQEGKVAAGHHSGAMTYDEVRDEQRMLQMVRDIKAAATGPVKRQTPKRPVAKTLDEVYERLDMLLLYLAVRAACEEGSHETAHIL